MAFHSAIASLSSMLAVTDKGMAYMVELLECLYHLKTFSQIPDFSTTLDSLRSSIKSFDKHFQVLHARFQSLLGEF
jgi:hypothetical protein